MRRITKLAGIALATALMVGGLSAGSASAAPTAACTGSKTVNGTLKDGAKYLIQCPSGAWNGTLLLYSHGYVVPGSPNPPTDVGDPLTGAFLLAHGFALAGSSYATEGWAIQQALPDQVNTLKAFDSAFGKPRTTIAWGHSLGGIITAGLIQVYPSLFNAALPMCGVLSGGVATWNTALDGAFAFQQLLAPGIQVVNIGLANAGANLAAGDAAAETAQGTAQGQARLALVAALSDTPGWFLPLSPEPAATDYPAQEVNQFEWDTQVTFPFVLELRAELEARAGGNVSWNTGVNYAADLAKSADLTEVQALYKAAGLSLTKDLRKLDSAPRIFPDLKAVAYLARYISFNGNISVPVLTMHTTGDGLVVPENEQAYRAVVDRDGNGNLLRQIFVNRAGHCAFTPAETLTALQTLLNRLSTGHWHVPSPAGLNAEATALGPLNVFVDPTSGQPVATAPQFISYTPTQYLRPFDLPRFIRGGPVPPLG